MSPYVVTVEMVVEPELATTEPEQWYAHHAEQVSRIPGVTKVERYWSVDEEGAPRHLALYHVTEPPAVMALRFAQAKEEGRLSGSPFASRIQRGYRLQSVLGVD